MTLCFCGFLVRYPDWILECLWQLDHVKCPGLKSLIVGVCNRLPVERKQMLPQKAGPDLFFLFFSSDTFPPCGQVFLRESLEQKLEKRREEEIDRAAMVIRAHILGYLAR